MQKTSVEHIKSKINVLNRFFGEMMIEDITADSVQQFITSRADESRAKKTVKEDLAVLKELLDSAVYDGLITVNPAKDRRVKNTAKAGSGTKALTREQAADILANIPSLSDPRERCLIALLAYTSCRREEVLGLKWNAVDFEKHLIHIRQAVVFADNDTVVKDTKMMQSVRSLPMSAALEQILAECRQEFGYVIAGEYGGSIAKKDYRALWASLKSHIELYGMTAINFRTTFATLAIASGVDLKTTQTLMGHSTPEITLAIYAKQEASALDHAMDRITAYLAT